MKYRLAIGSALLFGVITSGCGLKNDNLANYSKDNTGAAGATTTIVLINVDDNSAASARAISQALTPVVSADIANSKKIVLLGYSSGGVGVSTQSIPGMQSPNDFYSFDTQNSDRNNGDRTAVEGLLGSAIASAVRATKVSSVGDPRPLLRLASAPGSANGHPHIILWASFLSQGTDCLQLNGNERANPSLAAAIADRCASLGLLPTLQGDKLTIVGDGQSTTRPSVDAFGRALAIALCQKMTNQCEVQ